MTINVDKYKVRSFYTMKEAILFDYVKLTFEPHVSLKVYIS